MRRTRDHDAQVLRLLALDPAWSPPPTSPSSSPPPSSLTAVEGGEAGDAGRTWRPPAAVTGALVVCIAVAVGAGLRLALPSTTTTDVVPPRATAVSARPLAAAGRSGQPSGAATATPLSAASGADGARAAVVPGAPGSGGPVVHVVGRVVRPGLLRLPAGARVADALAAAGGPAPGADVDAVNLARPLTDGEQLRIPARGEAPPPSPGSLSGPAEPSRGDGAGAVDLNAADVAALDALPGIGPVTAGRILDYRRSHGPFRSVDQLAEVPGIGERTLDQLRPLVRVP
ncbi:MAG: ComEA family DNA-binding protein [Kineosporiaceae bacterium]